MYAFNGCSGYGLVKLKGKYYHMDCCAVDFLAMGNRWVSTAKLWSDQDLELKNWTFRGQLDHLLETMRSGHIVEHPEWLGLLPSDLNIREYKTEPDDPECFSALWSRASTLEPLSVGTAIQIGLLYQPHLLEASMDLR